MDLLREDPSENQDKEITRTRMPDPIVYLFFPTPSLPEPKTSTSFLFSMGHTACRKTKLAWGKDAWIKLNEPEKKIRG